MTGWSLHSTGQSVVHFAHHSISVSLCFFFFLLIIHDSTNSYNQFNINIDSSSKLTLIAIVYSQVPVEAAKESNLDDLSSD